jgi:GNAT superfamily N-acetyltransferase
LPSIEERAVKLFDGWLAETGLTREVLDTVTSVDEFEDARARGHLWVAASIDDVPVGFALVMILDGFVHLDEIDVVPECARRGVGTALVGAVCEWAAQEGYEKVTLSTFRDVPFNAPFYAALGFVPLAPENLPPEHVELVKGENARGLCVDKRIVMERRTAAQEKLRDPTPAAGHHR